MSNLGGCDTEGPDVPVKGAGAFPFPGFRFPAPRRCAYTLRVSTRHPQEHSVTTMPAGTPVPGLAPHLVLYALTVACDSKHDHEARLITDGRTAYVEQDHADVARVYRDRAEVSAVCPAAIHADEGTCAALVWDLTDSAGWGAAGQDDVAALTAYGVPVVE